MDKSRNYILDRITSKKTSIEEFNFDKLEAPPLSWFFSPFDIQELHDIAHSLKYSAKPKERYDAINRVCNRVGLVKFAAGTNRVVYRHPEFPDILFKIAADDIGLGDNPAEYRNQFLLKPFVAKTFEISPCGTVALVERVNPITSREEYISVADDVYTLITEWLIGKYVLADIGSAYFMNTGIRESFGVVLLDYPYLYELDGNKIFCSKPDHNSPTGKCDGEIDYDDGFNHLVCTKCGARYKAKELEKKIKDNELIVERQGDIKMNITIKGGSKNVCKSVNTEGINNDNFLSVRASIPTTTNLGDKIVEATGTKKVTFGEAEVKEEAPKMVIKKIADIVDNKEIPVEKEAKVEKPANKVPEVIKVDVEEKFVNGVSTSKNAVPTSPFTMSDEVKDKALANKKEKKTPVETIDNAVNTILEAFEDIDIISVREDTIIRAFDALGGKIFANAASFKRVIRIAADLLDVIDEEDMMEVAKDEDMLKVVQCLYSAEMKATNVTRDGDNLDIEYDINLASAADSDPDREALLSYTDNSILTIENIFPVEETEELEEVENPEDYEEVEEENHVNTDNYYTGLQFYHAKTVDVKELFPAEQPQDVIVFVDDEGRFLDVDGNIAGAYTINDQSVNATTVVSKKWLEDINQMLSEETAADNTGEVDEVVESAPVGALPVNAAVSTEEFLNNLEEEEAQNSEEE